MKTFNHIPIDTPKMKRILENGRRMYVDAETGNKYPSVTNVLSINQYWLRDWIARVGQENANKISQAAMKRGNHIHQLAETYMNNQTMIPNMFYADMWKSIKPEIEKIDNIQVLEKYLVSHKLKVAGTPDVIGDYDGVLSVIDFKTSSKTKYKKDIKNYFAQCAVGAVMYEELTGIKIDDIIVVIAVEDKFKPQVFKEKKKNFLGYFKKLRKQYKEQYGV